MQITMMYTASDPIVPLFENDKEVHLHGYTTRILAIEKRVLTSEEWTKLQDWAEKEEGLFWLQIYHPGQELRWSRGAKSRQVY